MGDPHRKAAMFEAIAVTGKALSNGKRLELLDLLAQGERSVEALARAAGLGLTTASAHLQTLRQAGLVATRREGTRIHYRLAGDDAAALYALLQQVARTHQAAAAQARTAYLGPDDTDHLTREELLDRVRAGTATVIDVRPAPEFAAGHIPGAVSIPLEELEARLAELPARRRGAVTWYPAEVSVVASLHGPADRPVRDAVLREVLDDAVGLT